jgi:putative hydrolase of the HAD superfamily
MGHGAVTAPLQREDLKALVFDLDGTLYQDERLGNAVNFGACVYISSLKGVSVEEADVLLQDARCKLSGPGGTLSRAVISLGGNLKDLHDRLNEEVRPEGVLSVDPRVQALLRNLGTKYDLYLYTNNNRELSARIMKEIGVTGLFRKIFTIQDQWLPKPDETVLRQILGDIAVQPEETLFVGDRYEVDLALPASLGCRIYEARTVVELLGLEQLMKEP